VVFFNLCLLFLPRVRLSHCNGGEIKAISQLVTYSLRFGDEHIGLPLTSRFLLE